MQEVTIYCDGSGTTNDKPCGFAAILIWGFNFPKEITGSLSNGTNNVAELMGAIIGLEALKRPCKVDVWSDSMYVVNGIMQNWAVNWRKRGYLRAVNNVDGSLVPEYVSNYLYWDRLLIACEKHDVTFHHVKGHSGNTENERCDKLANQARKAHVSR